MTINELLARFVKVDPIIKGWSNDKKYCVTVSDGTRYLLRISDISKTENRQVLFSMQQKVAKLGILMCVPVEFGVLDDGVYSLQSWIDGVELLDVIPSLTEGAKYDLGVKSGEILRAIHTVPAPDTQEEWELRFNKKIDNRINTYHECVEKDLLAGGEEYFLRYVENNRHLLANRPQCFLHGDFHLGNMMVADGELVIIDFDRYDFGDPWDEFNRMPFNAAASPNFATGMLHGYFGDKVSMEFFRLMAFYIAGTHLGGLSWAVKFGEAEINFSKKQNTDILGWYDNMKTVVPSWYFNKQC